MFETGMKHVLCPHSTFFNFAEIFIVVVHSFKRFFRGTSEHPFGDFL